MPVATKLARVLGDFTRHVAPRDLVSCRIRPTAYRQGYMRGVAEHGDNEYGWLPWPSPVRPSTDTWDGTSEQRHNGTLGPDSVLVPEASLCCV